MINRTFLGALAVSALFASGCGDKTMTTQPLTPTPMPTPIPTPAPAHLSMALTLSRATPPPSVKHAALASVVVTETTGHPVMLTRMVANSYYGIFELQVGGFTPIQLAGHQSASFTVTLTTNDDIPCAESVAMTIFSDTSAPAGVFVGCETVDWPF